MVEAPRTQRGIESVILGKEACRTHSTHVGHGSWRLTSAALFGVVYVLCDFDGHLLHVTQQVWVGGRQGTQKAERNRSRLLLHTGAGAGFRGYGHRDKTSMSASLLSTSNNIHRPSGQADKSAKLATWLEFVHFSRPGFTITLSATAILRSKCDQSLSVSHLQPTIHLTLPRDEKNAISSRISHFSKRP
jgi:hypothetical protein